MADQIIPLTNSPNQAFTVSLAVDGGTKLLTFNLHFAEKAGYWVMSVTDALTGVLLLGSIPLITGAYPNGNLIGQFAYLGIGSAYLPNVSGSQMDYPDDTNLGTDFVLVWGDTPGFVAAA